MVVLAMLSVLGLLSVAAVLGLLLLLLGRRRRGPKAASGPPGPTPWPVLGSLHLLGSHDNPFQAFTALSAQYGDIFSITLGSAPCVVVNTFELIKEVLVTKGSHFGGRPDFIRFHMLFGGDRNNSLALCDWSDLQKTRRAISRAYCSPRFASAHFYNLDTVGSCEVAAFADVLRRRAAPGQPLDVKPLLNVACFNLFTQYMCSKRFAYDDPDCLSVVRTFDEIFWEINQGYAVDFMPWLLPAYAGHMRKLSSWAQYIRGFIMANIVTEHENTLEMYGDPRDFTDALLMHLKEDSSMEWQHIIFELEDFLGGHSAVSNLVMLTLIAVVRNPRVGERIQREVDAATACGSRHVTLFDRASMPYTEAAILETLRSASSPIVPHVATVDSTIGGYEVKKGTVVFINNYQLNTGESYWSKPAEFMPERFLSADGHVSKPKYFIPFSTGKRTCIGQRLVQGFSFLLVASILQSYDVSVPEGTVIHTPTACVAVPPDTYSLVFTPRKNRESSGL
ncbi:cytochrome P450 307a1-like [Bacillus rossius redtenbacheri]|uniref:cytochrome P450 307a1-like n=1 Tax=Bacillus rossius redtenbacheri TaxID=93214 RepID=UPI002FDDDEBC